MSDGSEAGFAIVRKVEFELIAKLEMRRRPRVIALIAAVRSMHGGARKIAISDRDFREFGLAREAAGEALKDAVAIGLLEIVEKGGLTGRGHKTLYSVVFARGEVRETAGKPGISGRETRPFVRETAGKPATKGRETRPFTEETAGKPGNTQETSSTSSRKSKEEEVSGTLRGAPPPEDGRAAAIAADRATFRRRSALASDLQLPLMVLLNTAGGPRGADQLALKRERGELSLDEIRRRLRLTDRSGLIGPIHQSSVKVEKAVEVVPRAVASAPTVRFEGGLVTVAVRSNVERGAA